VCRNARRSNFSLSKRISKASLAACASPPCMRIASVSVTALPPVTCMVVLCSLNRPLERNLEYMQDRKFIDSEFVDNTVSVINTFDVGGVEHTSVKADRTEADSLGDQVDYCSGVVHRLCLECLEICRHLLTQQLHTSRAETERRVDEASLNGSKAVDERVIDVWINDAGKGVVRDSADSTHSKRGWDSGIAQDAMALQAGLTIQAVYP
jgi:hypothetical protein